MLGKDRKNDTRALYLLDPLLVQNPLKIHLKSMDKNDANKNMEIHGRSIHKWHKLVYVSRFRRPRNSGGSRMV